MRPCPNCGQSVAADRMVCPNCGATLPTVWPPPPAGMPPAFAPPRLLTRTRGGDIALGVVTGVLAPIVCSIGAALVRGLFFPLHLFFLMGGILIPTTDCSFSAPWVCIFGRVRATRSSPAAWAGHFWGRPRWRSAQSFGAFLA